MATNATATTKTPQDPPGPWLLDVTRAGLEQEHLTLTAYGFHEAAQLVQRAMHAFDQERRRRSATSL